MSDTKRCPYCAEEIRSEAVRCPLCRSRLAGFDVDHWHRDHDDARVAGVAVAMAHALSVPVGLVRAGFVVATFLHLLGAVVYGLLWLVIPPSKGERSLLERGLARAQEWARGLAGGRPRAGGPAAGRAKGACRESDAVAPLEVSPRRTGVIHHGGDGER
jgi:phage shock protein PspC (stress-responsive transcriptional regulator)